MSVRGIVAGRATGEVIKSSSPINFLGMVDGVAGALTDASHDLFGKKMREKILVFPHGIGSSVGAYTVYALKANGVAPAAMVCLRPDASVVSGCAIAGIPLVLVGEAEYAGLHEGDVCTIDTTSQTITKN